MIGDLLAPYYLWIKTVHVIAVISWMAGLLYLPRLFVHHAEKAPIGSETSEIFKIMEQKLYRLIMTPAMTITWICGLAMLTIPGLIDFSTDYWIWLKLAFVVGLTGFHIWLKKCLTAFSQDRNIVSGQKFRMMNEVPTVLMILIVVMVIVRPF